VPESLALLANSGYFARVARRHLNGVRQRVEQGEALADSLRRGGLLPAAMVPLVQASQRAGNLPWALAELGDHRANRRTRSLQRLSLVLFSALVFVIGLMVGFMVLGMFLPIIDVITRMSL